MQPSADHQVPNHPWPPLPPRATPLLGLALLLIGLAVYLPSLHNDFVWDARVVIANTPDIPSLDRWGTLFSQPSLPVQEVQGEQLPTLPYYRPLTKGFQILAHAAFGDRPLGYKLTSVLLHGGVTLLAFWLLLSVSRDRWLAALATLLFTLKPIHVEAVAWTYSASYLLTALFALGTLLLYRHGHRWLAPVGFALTLLFNEIGIQLLVVLCLHRWLLEGARRPRQFAPLLPYAAIAAAYLALRATVVGPLPLPTVAPLTFLNTAVVVLQRYVKIFFWPDAPVTFYLAETFPGGSPELAFSYLVLLALGALALWLWFRDKVGLFWLLWFGSWTAVSFNIGRLGDYLMAEKLIYIASIGPSMLLVQVLLRGLGGRPAPLVALVLAASVLQGTLTLQRLPYWTDTTRYLEAGLRFAPNFGNGQYNLANQYARAKRYELAQRHFERAHDLQPGWPLPLIGLGNVHYFQGKLAEAIDDWRRALALSPENTLLYFRIGMAAHRLGDLATARDAYRQYLRLEPHPPADKRRLAQLVVNDAGRRP